VVDDDQAVRETIGEILTDAGYECLLASDGWTALALFGEKAPDIPLVILDWAMDGLDGAETFRQLRRIDPGVRAILMSGYQRSLEVEGLVAEGIKAYIPKPFQIEDVVRIVHSVLGDR